MQVHHRQIFSMGTRLDLVLAGLEPGLCDLVTGEIKAVCDRVEALFSIHRHDSPLSILNGIAHKRFVKTGDEMDRVLRDVALLHRETAGYFDVTMKPVADLYRDFAGQGMPPLEKVRERVGMDLVEHGPEGVRFAREGVSIDLGGYGKGYAIKEVLPVLKGHGLPHVLLSFGESLIYGHGTHPYGDCWKVSVPVEGDGGTLIFELKDEALSTSGNSLNNQKKFGNSGHIVNPVTLHPVDLRGLVSVKAKDPVRAEVWSTALFSAGPELSQKILQQVNDLECRWDIPGNKR